jgi:hypothetical protein
VQVQKKGSHLQKNCSKVHEKCPGPEEMERGPKKCFPSVACIRFGGQIWIR